MTTEKMNIHLALRELKTLDSRIVKAINEAHFVVANKHSNTKIGGESIDRFTERASGDFQKIKDLIERRNAIKRAVVMSNAVTKVTVCGNEYTVAEAIEMKNHGLEYLRALSNKMATDYKLSEREADLNNGETLERKADAYIKNMYENTDMKNVSEDVKKARAEFITAQTYELIDPVKAHEQVEKLNDSITSFYDSVDAILSVSNATTEIEITY